MSQRDSQEAECTDCKGKGKGIHIYTEHVRGDYCDSCGGDGQYYETGEECTDCDGNGKEDDYDHEVKRPWSCITCSGRGRISIHLRRYTAHVEAKKLILQDD